MKSTNKALIIIVSVLSVLLCAVLTVAAVHGIKKINFAPVQSESNSKDTVSKEETENTDDEDEDEYEDEETEDENDEDDTSETEKTSSETTSETTSKPKETTTKKAVPVTKTTTTTKANPVKTTTAAYTKTTASEIPYTNTTKPPSGSISVSEFEKELFRLVNAERKKAGVPALIWKDDIHRATVIRSKEVHTLFSHQRPDGRDCFSALADCNVQHSYAGENIAKGGYVSKELAESYVESWMNSSGHRRNILDKDFVYSAIGASADENGLMSAVQLFTN